MKKFLIDQKYLESVSQLKSWSKYQGQAQLTEDELVEVLQGKDLCTSYATIDHPEFTKLREQLSKDGYIIIQRGWWNGDIVSVPFMLNGKRFKKNETFPCAGAMRGHMKYC